MHKRFEQQITLGTVAIPDVIFPLNSRDELPAIVAALQNIFITPELNNKVFELLENKICTKNKKKGRPGMDLWHILVLAVVRHASNTNWDTLESLSNYHELIRQIMGIHNPRFNESERITFNHQTIKDNVESIDEELLKKINQLVVEYGHKMVFKKKEDEKLRLKTDSFVVETNVHFPTDLNLLWDSMRKCLDMIEKLNKVVKIVGWRKIKSLRMTFKSVFRHTSNVVFKGKDEKKKKEAVKEYLDITMSLKERFDAIIKLPPFTFGIEAVAIIATLKDFNQYVIKLSDQIERRLIKGEVIAADEKIFSIFETHTEWITKGKQGKTVELGLLTLITTDQYQFIVDYKVMEKERDHAQVKPLFERIDKDLSGCTILSHSFDKGFYSKENMQILEESRVEKAILPKKGRHNKEDKERENDPEYIKLRHNHSAVESNINMLEHHGLNRCMDKGIKNFKRYVGLSVLAYNLHILGNIILEAERKKEAKQLLRKAA